MRARYNISGFETGWYFPESLSTATILVRSRNPEVPIPTMEEYLAMVSSGLARTALEVIERENDPAKQVAFEAKIAAVEPIVWKHEIKPAI